MNLQPVRPAVVLRDQFPLATRGDPEDAPERDVDEVQVTGPVERRPLEKAIDLRALAIGIGPRGAPLGPERSRHRHEHFGLDQLRLPERVEHERLLVARAELSAARRIYTRNNADDKSKLGTRQWGASTAASFLRH